MPDFITIVTIAGCAGSSLGFWSLGRSINRKGSLISGSSRLSARSVPQSLVSQAKVAFRTDSLKLFSRLEANGSAALTYTKSQCMLPSRKLVVHDGHGLAVVLRVGGYTSSLPVVIGKAQGSAIAPLVKRHESEFDDIHVDEALVRALYSGVPLLHPVTETLKIELLHILKSPLELS